MKNKTVINAGWIIACRLVQAVLALAVTFVSARYLGPANYGLVNYAESIVNFLRPVMQLGFNGILVKELVERPKEEGVTLGTALAMNVLSALVCMAGMISFVAAANFGQRDTLIVCSLYSIGLIFLALEMIQYWFQAHLKAKYASLTILAAYCIVAVYKLWLLITGKSICWFAIANSIDYMLIAVSLLAIYRKQGGQPLRFSLTRAREMLGKGKYYILSGLMVMIFAQTDKIMLKSIAGDAETGYYAAAVACTTMSNFVFVAIIDSARPSILKKLGKSKEGFEQGVSALYSIIIYLALAQCIGLTVLAGWIIPLLYGSSYVPAAEILRLAIWYTTFSYIGAVRDVWILGENKQHILWKINLCGALMNVALNAILIPIWGGLGAAAASLATQIFTNVILGFVVKPLRRNNVLILRSLDPRLILRSLSRSG